jgi:hypothetical protein
MFSMPALRRGKMIVVGLLAAGILLAVLADWLRTSPAEEIGVLLDGCCRAAEAGDAAALVSAVAVDYQDGRYAKEALRERFASLLASYPIRSVSVSGLEVDVRGSAAYAKFRTRVRAEAEEGMLGGGAIDWDLAFRREGERWVITRLAATHLNGQELRGGGLFEGY